MPSSVLLMGMQSLIPHREGLLLRAASLALVPCKNGHACCFLSCCIP